MHKLQKLTTYHCNAKMMTETHLTFQINSVKSRRQMHVAGAENKKHN